MAGWQLSWRVTLTWQSALYSPTGEAVQMVDVPTPARLRELVLAARGNPLIRTYSYRRHRIWDGSDAPPYLPTRSRAAARPRRGQGLPVRDRSFRVDVLVW